MKGTAVHSTARIAIPASCALLCAAAQAQIQTLWQRPAHADTVVFAPDGLSVANGGLGAAIYDAATGDQLRVLVARFNDAQSLAYSPDGTLIIEGVQSFNQNLNLFQAADAAVVRERITAHNNGTTTVAFNPAGTLVASAGIDGVTRFWSIPGLTEVANLPSGRRTFGIAYSPDGAVIATTGQHGVALWNTSDYSNITWLTDGALDGRAIAYSRDGALLAASFSCNPTPEGVCRGGQVLVWRTSDHTLLYTLRPEGTDGSFGLAFSPDGRTLAVAGDAGTYDGETSQPAYYGTLRFWDMGSGSLIQEFRQEVGDGTSAVLSVAYSPDGTRFAYSRYDGLLTMAEVTAPVRTCSADFNADGDVGTDRDIEAFFACLAGDCCAACPRSADFNGDGDVGSDQDIEAFFRVLAGGAC